LAYNKGRPVKDPTLQGSVPEEIEESRAEKEKALINHQGITFFAWCPREESNLHGVATTRT
jgi:hypothetical protein